MLVVIISVISLIVQIVIWLSTKPSLPKRSADALARLRGHCQRLIAECEKNQIGAADVTGEYE